MIATFNKYMAVYLFLLYPDWCFAHFSTGNAITTKYFELYDLTCQVYLKI